MHAIRVAMEDVVIALQSGYWDINFRTVEWQWKAEFKGREDSPLIHVFCFFLNTYSLRYFQGTRNNLIVCMWDSDRM